MPSLEGDGGSARGWGGAGAGSPPHTHVSEPREEVRERPGPAVTFVARVHPFCQQHAAQLALGALPVAHLGQVGCHAERVVADFALVVFADTAEEGTMRGLGLRPKESSFIAGCLSPATAVMSQQSFYLLHGRLQSRARPLTWGPRPSRMRSLGLWSVPLSRPRVWNPQPCSSVLTLRRPVTVRGQLESHRPGPWEHQGSFSGAVCILIGERMLLQQWGPSPSF